MHQGANNRFPLAVLQVIPFVKEMIRCRLLKRHWDIYIKTSGIDPRYDIYYFFDNIFILYLILSPQMITPGLDLSTDARGTENCNSVPVSGRDRISKIVKNIVVS